MRIGYLISEHPAVSHAFIAGEIEALRAQGIEICTASIVRPRQPGALSEADRLEVAATAYLGPGLAVNGPRALAGLLGRRPRETARAIRLAWQLDRRGARRPIRAVAWLLVAARLVEWARANAIHHVHVHFANPAALVARLAAETGELSVSLSVHGPEDFDEFPGNVLDEKCRGAAFVRTISRYSFDRVLRILSEEQRAKVAIVHCGVSLDAFQPSAASPSGDATFRLLCVGRLCANKAQADLLRAVRALRSEGVPVVLRLVGDGPERGRLEELARTLELAPYVTFAGAVGRDRIAGYLCACDVFALPSLAEGLPASLMEAMAAGRPVVSTAIAGIPELVQDGVTGLLVAPGDSDGLASALLRLWGDPDLRRRLARAGRARVESDFDQEASARAMADLFRRHGGGRGGAG